MNTQTRPAQHPAPLFQTIRILFATFSALALPLLPKAQNLQPGDLAVVGVSANTAACGGCGGCDEISFVCFKDIGSGTTFDLTDNGYERLNAGQWGDSEGVIRFTRTGGTILKGTVITYQLVDNSLTGTYEVISPDNGWDIQYINTPVLGSFAVNMNTMGDQMYFLSGGTWDNQGMGGDHNAIYSGGSVLFGFNTSTTWTPFADDSQQSGLHPEVVPCFHMQPGSTTDYLKYTGPLTLATQVQWINRIRNPANWTSYPSCAAYNNASPNYPQPVVLPIAPSGMSIECIANCTGCAPLSSTLSFNMPTVGGPFNVEYTNGSQNFNLSNVTDGTTIVVTVNTTTTYSLVSVTDQQGCPVYSNFEGDATLSVATPPVLAGVTNNGPLCEGETLQFSAPTIVGGEYDWSGPNNFSSALEDPAIANVNENLQGTYTLVVSINGCTSQPVSTNVTIQSSPMAIPTTLVECGSNGVATFDLVSYNNIVNGNTANAVDWYFDPAGQNPIPDPSAFSSGSTTVYAQVSNGLCLSPVMDIVLQVNDPVSPILLDISICESNGSFNLTGLQDPNFPNGTWAGPGVSGNLFNPTGLGGVVPLTFTPSDPCTLPGSTAIFVVEATIPAISGVPSTICQNAAAISLPTQQSGINGTWSGNGVTANMFNPSGLSGNIVLTFTPTAGQCAATATTLITVNMPVAPTVSGVPASICETASPVNLPTTLGSITGTWSGNGTSANLFDPAGLSGTVALVFTPATGQCATPVTANVVVNEAETPSLGLATVCQTSNVLNLNTLNDPNFPAGTWSGTGVTGSNFNPSGLSGAVVLTFTPTTGCATDGTTTVTVNVPTQPQLGTAEVCQNEAAFTLTSLQDPNFPTGTWTGNGVSGGSFNPAGQNGAVNLVFTPTATCSIADTTTVTVNSTPGFMGLSEVCDPVTQSYTVTFSITGGEAPYTVNGTGLSGNIFTSTPQISGTTYTFLIDDANGCGPVEVTGTENCNCATDAGTMVFGGGAFLVCYNVPTFQVYFNDDETLDNNDVLQFVLHDNAGGTLGTVTSWSDTTVFDVPTNIVQGQTYYVSAVAGNDDGTGNVDLTDPCLSVSPGLPVIFYSVSGELQAVPSVCASDCFDVEITFQGEPPFTYEYITSYNPSSVGVIGVDANSVFEICPADFGITSGAITFDITGIIDKNGCPDVSGTTVDEISVDVVSAVINDLVQTICPGESVVVNGQVYDAATPFGIETIVGGSSGGCDSIVNVDLSFFPVDTFFLDQTLCTGGSITVNGSVYNQTNPAGTEVLANAGVNGCDSVVVVNLNFNNVSVGSYIETLCPGTSVVVNGETYDESNPTGTELIPNGSYLGCDSVVNVALSFFPSAIGQLNQQLCTGGSITVNGTVYDETNPMGTEVLVAGSMNGCDSTVIVSLTFNSVVLNALNETLCEGENMVVNGTVYDAGNPTGTETIVGGSYLGCDSVIQVNLQFFPPAISIYEPTVCAGGSVTINGTVYNENNPAGVEVLPGMSFNGCDSIVTVNLIFIQAVENTVEETLCAGESILVNNTVYNETNPTGTETIVGGSYLGCDSVIVINLSFIQLASFTIDDQFCTGGSITVNGTVYNAANPSGTEVFANAAANGCDSIVVVDLTFGNEVIVDLNPTLCAGESVFINGTLYFVGNPTGSETFAGGSYLGCDSTINISLSFYPDAVFNLNQTLDPNGAILIGNTVFNQQNPNGIVVLPGASSTGCDSTVIVNLTFEGLAIAEYEITPPLCRFGNDGTIRIDTIFGGTPPYIVALNGANSAPVTAFPLLFSGLDAGFHSLTVQDAAGTFTVIDLVVPDPPTLTVELGDDLVVPLGNSVTLSPQANFDVAGWTWAPTDFLSCTDCESPISTPTENIVYLLTAVDANGCTVSDELSVMVEKLRQVYVPNVFSPNGDGFNDELTVFAGAQVLKINKFQVFDRWGALVFEQFNFLPNNLQLGWNGDHKGDTMNPAVFTWFAEVEFLDGKVELFEGGVTLIR